MRYALLILAVFVSGCATNPKPIAPTPQEVDRADLKAREALQSETVPIPENLVRAQRGPVSVEQRPDMNEDIARGKWQTDRSRLRQCVAVHGTLVKELDVRGLLK